MSDPQTTNPDQLPQLAGVPADWNVIGASPGGPLQRMPFDLLLSRLIAADLVKLDEATLLDDLEHDEHTVALVHSDPTPDKNGWYRKVGASGGGTWEQFEVTSLGIRAAIEALAEQAELAAADSRTLLERIEPALIYTGESAIPPVAVLPDMRVVRSFDTLRREEVGLLPSRERWAHRAQYRRELAHLPPIMPNERTVLVDFVIGQSTANGSTQGDPVVSAIQQYLNLGWGSGPRTTFPTSPEFGDPVALREFVARSQTETPTSGFADGMVEYAVRHLGALPARVVQFGVGMGKGATQLSSLNPGSSKGTEAVRALQAIQDYFNAVNAANAATPGWVNYVVRRVKMGLWQGHADIINSTYEQYYNQLGIFYGNWDTKLREIFPAMTEPVQMLIQQLSYKVTKVAFGDYGAVARAQRDFARDNINTHLLPPTYAGTTKHTIDGVHHRSIGYYLQGHYAGIAAAQLAYEGREPWSMDCISATYALNRAGEHEVRLQYRVPTPPLRWNFDEFPMVPNYGFNVKDADGTLTISDWRIENGVELVLIVNRAPSPTTGVVESALTGQSYFGTASATNPRILEGAATNLSDSTVNRFRAPDGNHYEQPYWSPHFRQTIVHGGF